MIPGISCRKKKMNGNELNNEKKKMNEEEKRRRFRGLSCRREPGAQAAAHEAGRTEGGWSCWLIFDSVGG